MSKNNWTRKELIEFLRTFEKEHGFAGAWRLERTQRPGFVNIRHALKKEFGSLRRAKEAAGVRTWPIWTRESVKNELLGRVLRGEHLSLGANVRLDSAARRLYGTWRKALAACVPGLVPVPDPSFTRRSRRRKRRLTKWSRERVILKLQAVHREGRDFQGMKTREKKLYRAARRWLGGWRAALRAAGIPIPIPLRSRNPWTPERILEALREESREGRDLRAHAIRGRIRGLAKRALQEFGPWRAVLWAAGIPALAPHKKWTPARILAVLRRKWKVRESLGSGQILRHGGGLYRAARREFGSWRKALEAAGVLWNERLGMGGVLPIRIL